MRGNTILHRLPQQRAVVVIGNAPPLEDVLSGASAEAPFDLASFTTFAERSFFTETLMFLAEVGAIRYITTCCLLQHGDACKRH